MRASSLGIPLRKSGLLLFITAVCVIGFGQKPSAPENPDSNVVRETLPNGLRVIIVPRQLSTRSNRGRELPGRRR